MEVASREYFLGLDLGQRRDRTAVAIIERSHCVSATGRNPITWEPLRRIHHNVRFLQRLPLHTPYTAVSQHVAGMANRLAALGTTIVAVDATGVGLPIVDALRIVNAPWRLMPVTIGFSGTQYYDDGFFRVPKRDLIANLQLAAETRAFAIPGRLRESEVLLDELCSMRASTRHSGHTRIEAPGNQHDDLAIALSLAWWAVENCRARPLGINKPLL